MWVVLGGLYRSLLIVTGGSRWLEIDIDRYRSLQIVTCFYRWTAAPQRPNNRPIAARKSPSIRVRGVNEKGRGVTLRYHPGRNRPVPKPRDRKSKGNGNRRPLPQKLFLHGGVEKHKRGGGETPARCQLDPGVGAQNGRNLISGRRQHLPFQPRFRAGRERGSDQGSVATARGGAQDPAFRGQDEEVRSGRLRGPRLPAEVEGRLAHP